MNKNNDIDIDLALRLFDKTKISLRNKFIEARKINLRISK